jgi:3-hydroxyacyl-CoA dehydrogenase
MKGGNYRFSKDSCLILLNFLGPFRFMDTYGVSKIVDLMNNYRSKYGDRFAPTQLLVDMAKENKKFYSK